MRENPICCGEKINLKFFKKSLKKVLTKCKWCGIIIRRSKKGVKKRTLKIKQRRNKDPTILERNRKKSQVYFKV